MRGKWIILFSIFLNFFSHSLSSTENIKMYYIFSYCKIWVAQNVLICLVRAIICCRGLWSFQLIFSFLLNRLYLISRHNVTSLRDRIYSRVQTLNVPLRVSLTRLGQFECFTVLYIRLSNFLAEFVQIIKFYRHEHNFAIHFKMGQFCEVNNALISSC